jgi:hypothetical protein
MCDFHSIVCRHDGAIGHIAANSHSGAVAALKWLENDQVSALRGVPRFLECEWSGEGEYPGADYVTRGVPNEKQAKAIDGHYQALAKLLSDPASHAERMLFEGGIFAGDEYADVRWKVLNLPECPRRVADKLVTLALHAQGEKVRSIDPRIAVITGNLAIAKGCTVEARNLSKVTGDVWLYQGVSFTAPVLAQTGYVRLDQGASFTAPVLAQTGYVRLDQGASFTAPVLAQTGYVWLDQGVSFTAPVLAQTGDVRLDQGASFTAPVLAQTGYVWLDQGASFTAPVLADVKGTLTLSQSATLDAPNLKTVNGKPYTR